MAMKLKKRAALRTKKKKRKLGKSARSKPGKSVKPKSGEPLSARAYKTLHTALATAGFGDFHIQRLDLVPKSATLSARVCHWVDDASGGHLECTDS